MLSREGKQTDRGAVGAEFIGYNRRRREALLLQEFPHQPNCRPSVPAGLNQEIQDFALTVHGTPEIELPPSNYDDHLVQVPAFGRSWPPTLNPPRIGPTEFQDPSSNCLIRDVETTLGKQVLNVPIAQRETAIEPDGMLDDDRWKAVTTVGYLAHPETLKHRPCRSHAVNVTMPCIGFDDMPRPMQTTMVSRSFGTEVRDYDELANAITMFATDAARSIRRANLVSTSVSVFIETNRFGKSPHHAPSCSEALSPATNNTKHVMKAALTALKHIYREGLAYKRAGVMLLDLVEAGRAPISLFDTQDPRDDKLIEAFDAINDRLGLGAIQFGPAVQAAAWRSSSAFRSPFYTTRWEDIPKVKT